ncbi:Short-chain dehydrogenase/reductase SDR [Penicillium coprophilum]|uniref:Short-chain dehydrogenase/reductase SDR n=1 Tax=Penicillium coprophilum TaxID=36646 RepID=UPI002398C436|nr:Short-chain dehydrogenase/reductase SDR [Penicillium coprophilum]KAJ5177565.1 Short-chain dehydrogenase/reductase SDR [Penicillium coprophilum]
MPIPIIAQGLRDGISSIPHAWTVLRIAPWVLALAALKYYFEGARNSSERMMRSKVIMVTGGTSGIGAEVVRELATRGAQVILLTRQPPSDLFLSEYIEDLRTSTKNHLIHAEQVDLSSLHSIRTFATKWIDNIPPRRLDCIILAGATAEPSGPRALTTDGIDIEWQTNYLANFHLLSILSPALRAQPAHRDVRVIFATCSSYIGGDFSKLDSVARGKQKVISKRTKTSPPLYEQPKGVYALSKLALTIFAHSFQRHLNAYQRPDSLPPCTRVIVVDPGLTRTPGTRRWLTGGSLWGLALYLLTWPVWWLLFKSPVQGAQSILYAAMEQQYGRGGGGWLIKECREMDYARADVRNDEVGKKLWEFSGKMVEEAEKESAVMRALEKKAVEVEKQAAEAEKVKKERAETTSKKGKADGSRRSRKGQK